MNTERLEIRLPEERDRERLVDLFTTDTFMVYSLTGALDDAGANRRFDRMLAVADDLPFCKQPVIERATGTLIGYAGADLIDWRDERRLEWGYRLAEEARGKGYATEACQALLDQARETHDGEVVLGLIDPTNHRSRNVLRKLGFTYIEQTLFEDRLPCEVHEISLSRVIERP